jgi:peptidoglycan/xylan/chitin deacetylase (PgdA/CDA1 family)
MSSITAAPISKRERAASWSARLGITGLLETMPQRPILMVLNYHRIGDPNQTPYDPGTFTSTTQEFDQQVGWLKKRFPIITLAEALAVLEGKQRIRRTQVLITFDDGYLDNYREAFPVLRSHGVSAVFFLPTYFIGTGHVPWWDLIAYVVKRSHKRRIELTYPVSEICDIDKDGLAATLRRILFLAVKPESRNPEIFLSHLEVACDSLRPREETERCFLSWDEAREMLKDGMDFGSHTHSHEILSSLSPGDQYRELVQSRETLTAQLGRPVDTLAYPVGLKHTFTSETIDAARSAGYRGAFSFYGGPNLPGQTNAFDIRRYPVNWGYSLTRLRLQTAWVSVLGEGWF